ncbi:hypothetical protein KIN20_011574 [Parelaphostrongylus tenuis]|uniref:Uncharacterized protein n=1 Tax=Parelaphostrongylus tenuis TaxID=148309 RepID=A0AAD5M9N0_PARTN|nr:hypothetical protein KIN20_011574 [Parelaphostrongylus tenuis]
MELGLLFPPLAKLAVPSGCEATDKEAKETKDATTTSFITAEHEFCIEGRERDENTCLSKVL